MGKKRAILHGVSMLVLTVPNLTYLGINFDILKEANAVSLTMTALLVLSVIGVGAITHIKVSGGVWCALIGIFIIALSNIAYIAGFALIIEGVGVASDHYIFKPLIEKEKIKELRASGESVTYTREVK